MKRSKALYNKIYDGMSRDRIECGKYLSCQSILCSAHSTNDMYELEIVTPKKPLVLDCWWTNLDSRIEVNVNGCFASFMCGPCYDEDEDVDVYGSFVILYNMNDGTIKCLDYTGETDSSQWNISRKSPIKLQFSNYA